MGHGWMDDGERMIRTSRTRTVGNAPGNRRKLNVANDLPAWERRTTKALTWLNYCN